MPGKGTRREGVDTGTESTGDLAPLTHNLVVLAEKTSRFPGTSSGYDFARFPQGVQWDPEELAQRIRKELENSR